MLTIITKDSKTGIVLFTNDVKGILYSSVITDKQIWVGDICIAIYVIDIKKINNGNPALFIVAKANGRAITIIACDPAIKVPKKNINPKIIYDEIGNLLK